MSAIMKILIKENMKIRRLLGPIGVGVMGTVEVGIVGIVGSAVALGPSGMSVTARQKYIRSKKGNMLTNNRKKKKKKAR